MLRTFCKRISVPRGLYGRFEAAPRGLGPVLREELHFRAGEFMLAAVLRILPRCVDKGLEQRSPVRFRGGQRFVVAHSKDAVSPQ